MLLVIDLKVRKCFVAQYFLNLLKSTIFYQLFTFSSLTECFQIEMESKMIFETFTLSFKMIATCFVLNGKVSTLNLVSCYVKRPQSPFYCPSLKKEIELQLAM